MQKTKAFLTLITLCFVVSCASMYMQDPYMNINQGMTKQDVVKFLGNPSDRTFQGELEKWYYKSDLKVVTFKNDLVVSLREDTEEINRRYEIEKAKAGSVKIDIGKGHSERSKPKHPLPCVGSNFNGKFAKGGGCNTFGCWPPNGSCNTFGCTMIGECTIGGGCPQEIKTYKCKDYSTY